MSLSTEQIRKLVAQHGKVAIQPPQDWKGPFPLPETLLRYYAEVGPVDVNIKSHGNAFHLPRLSKLWKFQAGYGWNDVAKQPFPDWDDDWLVIADQGGDPFILSRSTDKILFAEHGAGKWEPKELFPNPNTMAACLGLIGQVVVLAGDEFTDEDCQVVPEHREKAVAVLTDVLGTKAGAEDVLETFGWGC